MTYVNHHNFHLWNTHHCMILHNYEEDVFARSLVEYELTPSLLFWVRELGFFRNAVPWLRTAFIHIWVSSFGWWTTGVITGRLGTIWWSRLVTVSWISIISRYRFRFIAAVSLNMSLFYASPTHHISKRFLFRLLINV